MTAAAAAPPRTADEMRIGHLEEALVIAYAALAGLQANPELTADVVAERLEGAVIVGILARRPELACHLAGRRGWRAGAEL
jgi:hypothetical protein